jgi:hypothetical protein
MSNQEPDQATNLEIPNWVVNQIGKLTLENELLRSENAVLRSAIQQALEAQEQLNSTDSEEETV